MQEREDAKLVIDMRKALKLDKYRPKDLPEDLRNYRRILEASFDRDRHREKMGLSEFFRRPCGECWKREGSLLLVLCGRNEGGIGTVTDSWLSPVAMDLLDSLLNSNTTVAFDICNKSSTLEGVISRLIYQLLEKNP